MKKIIVKQDDIQRTSTTRYQLFYTIQCQKKLQQGIECLKVSFKIQFAKLSKYFKTTMSRIRVLCIL